MQPSERARELDLHIDQLVMSAPRQPHTPERRLIHRVLSCIGEDDATNVLSWTREIATLFAADVTLIHVTRPIPPAAIYPAAGALGFGVSTLPIPYQAAARESAGRKLREATRALADDVPQIDVLEREGHPGDNIVRAARELASDLIIIGHHEGGALDRLLVGSTTDHVKNHTQADVLIARTHAVAGPILAGVDGSPASRQAAQLADELAQRWSTTLHLLHVVPRRWHSAADEAVAEDLRANMLATGTTTSFEGVEMDLRMGDARDSIRLAARGMNAGLIVLGSRGASGLRSLMPGSVSNALAHDSPASVLLVRDEALQ